MKRTVRKEGEERKVRDNQVPNEKKRPSLNSEYFQSSADLTVKASPANGRRLPSPPSFDWGLEMVGGPNLISPKRKLINRL